MRSSAGEDTAEGDATGGRGRPGGDLRMAGRRRSLQSDVTSRGAVRSARHEDRNRGWNRNRRRRGGARARAPRARGARPVAARAGARRRPARRQRPGRCARRRRRGRECRQRQPQGAGGRHGAAAARRQGGRGASLRRRLDRRRRPRRHPLLQGQARAGGADPALGRPLDDRARDAVPPVPGADVRGQREGRHRALPEVPDAAGRSTRGRPCAGRDGRGRAGAGDHAVRGPGGAERVRAGPALAPADRLARGVRAPARDPRAALGRADEPGREARQRDLRRVARLQIDDRAIAVDAVRNPDGLRVP